MSERIVIGEERKIIIMDPSQADIFISRQRGRSLRRKIRKMYVREGKVGSREDRRKAAKRKLLDICESIGIVEGKRRALALFSLQTGHTMERAEAYLNELIDAGLIEVEGDRIISTSIASKKRLEEIKAAGIGRETMEETKKE